MLPGAWNYQSSSTDTTESTSTSRPSTTSTSCPSTHDNNTNSSTAATSNPTTNPTTTATPSSSSSYSYSSNDLRRRNVEKEVIGRKSWWSSLGTSFSSKPTSPPLNPAVNPDSSLGLFECHICMDTASDPVVTMCGHLFCWPCIYKWMTSGNTARGTCPVCKSLISKEKCTPIYAHGRESRDPRNDIPTRPAAQREEAPQPQSAPRPPGTGILGSNTHVSFGFGPLGMFGMQFDLGNAPLGNNPPQGNNFPQSPAEVNQQFIIKIFVFIVFLIFWAFLIP